MNIKDPRTDSLVRRLAAQTGESITVATRIAVEERLARLTNGPYRTARDDLLDVVKRARARQPALDRGSDDEILGYGHDGLPA